MIKMKNEMCFLTVFYGYGSFGEWFKNSFSYVDADSDFVVFGEADKIIAPVYDKLQAHLALSVGRLSSLVLVQ
jgi:hypothetical protein